MPLHPAQIRSILDRTERGQSIAVIANQLGIRRADVREALGQPEKPMFTSEQLPGISTMSDHDALLSRQPRLSPREQEYLEEQVWSIAAEIRASNMAKSRGEVVNA